MYRPLNDFRVGQGIKFWQTREEAKTKKNTCEIWSNGRGWKLTMERSSTYTTYMVFFLLDLRCIERPWWGRRKKTYKMANEGGNRVRYIDPKTIFSGGGEGGRRSYSRGHIC